MNKPTIEGLIEISKDLSLNIPQEDMPALAKYIDVNVIPTLEKLEQMIEPKPSSKYPRERGQFPSPKENRYGAWAWRCTIKGSGTGLLSGKKIALKDNVSVAGIPLTNGTAAFKGYVPNMDATVVTRILDAGGDIVGKSSCENFCYSGGSHTSYPLPVLNPNDSNYMAGGSSSGSAVLVATGEVDLAIGADQGGSIRIPSSWCGILGLKPTWGLVPYTGLVSGEMTEDHVGPMARTVRELAMLLQVIAGRDGLDPRQALANTPELLPDYVGNLLGNVQGLRLGIVKEGFNWPESDDSVSKLVLDFAYGYQGLGAKVDEVSVPIHKDAGSIFAGIDWIGSFNSLMEGGQGHGWLGLYDTHLAEFLSSEIVRSAEHLSIHAKLMIMLGRYLSNNFYHKLYSKASNLRRVLRDAYDQVLQSHDILVMPTTPQKPQPFPHPENVFEMIDAGWNMLQNTSPFDITGHPALNVPCGKLGLLPVGAMLVSKHFEERTLLNAAYVHEQNCISL